MTIGDNSIVFNYENRILSFYSAHFLSVLHLTRFFENGLCGIIKRMEETLFNHPAFLTSLLTGIVSIVLSLVVFFSDAHNKTYQWFLRRLCGSAHFSPSSAL